SRARQDSQAPTAGAAFAPRPPGPPSDLRQWHRLRLPSRIGASPLRSIVAWSRIFNDRELLAAIDPDPEAASTAFATIHDGLHAAGSRLTCLYSTDASEIGGSVAVEPRNGKSVLLRVPAAGFVVYA